MKTRSSFIWCEKRNRINACNEKRGDRKCETPFDEKNLINIRVIRHGASQMLELFPHGSKLFRGKIKLPFKDIFFRSVSRLCLAQEFSRPPLFGRLNVLFYLCNLRSLSFRNLEPFSCRIFIYFLGGISWILRFFNPFKLYSYCSWTLLLKSLELKSSDPIEITNLANGNFYNWGRLRSLRLLSFLLNVPLSFIFYPAWGWTRAYRKNRLQKHMWCSFVTILTARSVNNWRCMHKKHCIWKSIVTWTIFK